ncbi:hypothetical protein [Actinomadura sp. HBU206391]|uniref:hypothetical protein n=1 Tax=Actinomadura sp. HBU206391 TaxID=2731692 RepID=UPI00164EFFC9|nr:hypothetical protein [Actinomadura sp. HBU206391]MBC6460936.1 hypothetical protein [Actinomadura sp. HBU206391]
MAGTLRVPRSRGAFSGLLLLLLGLWGGLIPFVGPYVDFAYTPDKAWVYTSDRLWLAIAPAVATGLGGLILLLSANRVVAMFGAWIAALGGAWFVVGGPVSALWTENGASATGSPVGDEAKQVAEQLAFFYGLGALIVFFAALALGRLAVVAVRDARLAEEQAAVPPHETAYPKSTPPDGIPPEPARPVGETQPLPRRYARRPEPDSAAPQHGDRMVAPYQSNPRTPGM